MKIVTSAPTSWFENEDTLTETPTVCLVAFELDEAIFNSIKDKKAYLDKIDDHFFIRTEDTLIRLGVVTPVKGNSL